MESKSLKIFCFFCLISTFAADHPNFTERFEDVARLAFKKHYPAFTFEKLLSQNVDHEKNLIDFFISSSKSDSPKSGIDSTFICSLKVKLDSKERLLSDPQVEAGICDAKSSHATARQSGAVRDIHSIHNVTEEEMGLVKELADFAAKKLDEIDADNRKNVVEAVLNPTKQFAGGILYEFTLKLVETNCPETDEDNEACKQSAERPVKLCNVKVLRTWALKKALHATLVESHCQPEYETLYAGDRRSKQVDNIFTLEDENHSEVKFVGGLEDIDINDDNVVKYAKDSLATLDGLTNSKYKLGLIRVVNAKVQLVAGLLYYLKLEVGDSKCLKAGSKGVECSKEFSEPKICNVQVWVQEWLDSVRISDASCENKPSAQLRKKRSPKVLAGGWQSQSVNNTEVLEYAQYSLSTLEGLAGLQNGLKLVEVVEAQTQVVAGINYKLKLKVADSKEDSKICSVTVWVQPWLNKKEVTEASCEDKPSVRRKRSSVGIRGGLTPADVNNANVQKYAKYALSTLESLSDSKDKLKLVEVVEAKTQVVAGVIYHLKLKVANSKDDSKICQVKVSIDAGGGDPEVYDASCEDNSSSVGQPSTEKPLPIFGGLQPVDVNNEKVQTLAQFSLSTLQTQSGSKDELKLVKVTEAYSQVVSGVMYHLTLTVSNPKGESKSCKVKVVEQPWVSKEPKVIDAFCENKPLSRKRRSMEERPVLGGLKPVDVNDEKVQSLAKFSLSTLQTQSGSKDELKLVKVTEAKKQVVAGTLYHLTLTVSNPKGESKSCKVKVLEQPWISKDPKVTDASCENKPSSRKRRSVLGGLESIDVNNEKVQTLAKFSLSTLQTQLGSKDELKLVKVTEAKKQVVAGTMYHLTLTVSNPKGESKSCKVKVVEQPWVSKEPKVTDAFCDNKPISRKRRSMEGSDAPVLGGFKSIDVNDDKVQSLAKFSLSTLQTQSGSKDELKLVKVTEAKKQVVAGMLYHLTLTVSNPKGESKSCKVKVLEQPWVSKDPKVTDASCENKPSSRKRRSMEEPERPVLGGLKSVDVNDEKVRTLAQFSLSTLETLSGLKGKLTLVKVTEARKQVVSGIMHHLTLTVSDSEGESKSCKVKVLEQPWISKDPKVTDASCEMKVQSTEESKGPMVGGLESVDINDEKLQELAAQFSFTALENLPHKQQSTEESKGPMVGGLEPVDINDEKVQQLAQFSLSILESLSEFKGKLTLVKVTEAAQKQIVSGLMHHLTLTVSDSEGKSKSCKVRVLEQPWIVGKQPKVTDAYCENKPSSRKRRSKADQINPKVIAGGLKPIAVNNEDVQKYAKYSLSTLQGVSGSKDELTLVEVIEAHSQVVAGIKYHLKLKVTNSKSESKICNVKVWVQPWISKDPKNIEGSCEDKPLSRRKRDILAGGLTPISKDDPEVQKYAKQALSSLESQSGSNEKLKLVDIEEAYTQVVSGELIHLKLRVASSKGDSKSCQVKIWVQPWLNSVQVIDPSCDDKPVTRIKRDADFKTVDVNDAEVKEYADLAVSSLPGFGFNSEDKLKIVEIFEAKKRDVPRLLYQIKLKLAYDCSKKYDCEENPKICTVRIDPKLEKKIEDVWCVLASRTKRSTEEVLDNFVRLSVDPSDKKVQKYIKSALPTIEKLLKSDKPLKLIKLISGRTMTINGYFYDSGSTDTKGCPVKKLVATSSNDPKKIEALCDDIPCFKDKLVSGEGYILQIAIASPSCTKYFDKSECSKKLVDPKICNVTFFVENGLIEAKALYAECNDISSEREKRSNIGDNKLVGGIEPFSANDDNVQRYAQMALAKLDGVSNSQRKLGLKRVVDAKVQIVSGLSYTLTLEVGESECLKSNPTSDPNPNIDCLEKISNAKNCTVKVWVREWLNSTEISNAFCEDKPATTNRITRSNIDYEEDNHPDTNDETKPKQLEFLQTSLDETNDGEQQPKSVDRLVQVNIFSSEDPRTSIQDEETLRYLNLTMKTLDDLTPSPFKLGVIKLTDLKKQIGPKNISLTLKLEVGYTKCPKSEDDSIGSIECAKELTEPRKCFVKLTVPSEPSQIEVEAAVCDGIPDKITNRRKRLSVGGRQPLNTESESIKKKSNELLPKLLHHFKNETVLSLNRVIEANVQVVNGVLYTYVMEVLADEPCGIPGIVTFCDGKKDVTHQEVRKYCLVKVLEKEWMNLSEVIFSKCTSNLSKLQKV